MFSHHIKKNCVFAYAYCPPIQNSHDKIWMTFAFCNLIGLGSGVLSDCVDQDNFSWGPFAYSLAVSPVAGMYIFQVLPAYFKK